MEPQSGTSLDQIQGINIEQQYRKITSSDVEQARIKEREAYTKLLDDMEASVETQGQWFVKIGDKKPITENQQVEESTGFLGRKKTLVDREVTTGHKDTRALVLKAIAKVSPHDMEMQEFTVVTPDGIFVAPFYTSAMENPGTRNETDDQRKFNTLKEILSGRQQPTEGMGYSVYTHEKGYIYLRAIDLYPNSTYGGIHLENPSRYGQDFTPEDFQKRVQESINLTESPHKTNLEEANKNIKMASSASSVIQNLPPRE